MEEITLDCNIVKLECVSTVCQGCLSTDRTLVPLGDNSGLFLYLMGPYTEDLQSSEMAVCWECAALVRRLRRFQMQVQHAQYLLKLALADVPSLSALTTVLIKDTPIKYEENEHISDHNTDVKDMSTQNKTDATYNEILLPPKVDIEIVDAKEEPELSDNYVQDDTVDNAVKEEKKKHKVKNKYNSSRLPAPIPLVTPNILDSSNMSQYYTPVYLSLEEMEALVIKRNDKSQYKRFKSKCKQCKLAFRNQLDLNRHVTFKHMELSDELVCTECGEAAGSREALAAHWRRHCCALRCALCRRLRLRRSDMHMHLREHVKRYTCRRCRGTFYMRRDFLRHYKEEHRKPLVCDHCGKQFQAKWKIEKHMIREHLPPKCKVCGASFASQARLSRHVSRAHAARAGQAGEAAYCVECDKQFATLCRYKAHLRASVTHTPRKKISVPCPDCGKVFSRKTYLNNHYRLFHLKQSKHYCDICNKYFANSYGVRLHRERVHQGIRPPKTKVCDTCGMAFETQPALTRHVRTHTGERPYKCALCAAAFTQHTPLKSHLRTQHKLV